MRAILLLVLLLSTLPVSALAQFGVILPSDDAIDQGEKAQIVLQLRLIDPLTQHYAALAKPKRFGVQLFGEETNLLTSLKPGQGEEALAWLAEFTVKRPGDYLFHAETAPGWDAEAEQFIVYHVKLCVNAFGVEEGWDEPVGVAAEIIPLSRPYGLWAGNLFSGQLLVDGEPAPYVAIEIAYLGSGPGSFPPARPYRTQTVRADASGIFHYAMPRAGWWGFAATVDADWTIRRDGDEKPVSLVTSYWVQIRDMP